MMEICLNASWLSVLLIQTWLAKTGKSKREIWPELSKWIQVQAVELFYLLQNKKELSISDLPF